MESGYNVWKKSRSAGKYMRSVKKEWCLIFCMILFWWNF